MTGSVNGAVCLWDVHSGMLRMTMEVSHVCGGGGRGGQGGGLTQREGGRDSTQYLPCTAPQGGSNLSSSPPSPPPS